ncbi:uncharacterized protein B0P05DRAFT_537492 [Gilbertella persicaria]|uniref:uncharacterized protein n=1 Tax=Gilbertella persicaria TaxID=101096 RepID=UPI00221F5B08|nr:uncharacterized protein B0P05DRAFT_537492 [Gilbertella persicaria]KAI8082553.1 hypothetical protein B0P05DRAFT_537492 [Gilbertella persicaria]
MIRMTIRKQETYSITSNHSIKSIWDRLSQLLHFHTQTRCLSTSSDQSQTSSKTRYRKKYTVEDTSVSPIMKIPPFSPTYCRPNEFPYSNFYVKLPNGKWMIRYRSGNRDILGTDEFESYLI